MTTLYFLDFKIEGYVLGVAKGFLSRPNLVKIYKKSARCSKLQDAAYFIYFD